MFMVRLVRVCFHARGFNDGSNTPGIEENQIPRDTTRISVEGGDFVDTPLSDDTPYEDPTPGNVELTANETPGRTSASTKASNFGTVDNIFVETDEEPSTAEEISDAIQEGNQSPVEGLRAESPSVPSMI